MQRELIWQKYIYLPNATVQVTYKFLMGTNSFQYDNEAILSSHPIHSQPVFVFSMQLPCNHRREWMFCEKKKCQLANLCRSIESSNRISHSLWALWTWFKSSPNQNPTHFDVIFVLSNSLTHWQHPQFSCVTTKKLVTHCYWYGAQRNGCAAFYFDFIIMKTSFSSACASKVYCHQFIYWCFMHFQLSIR